MKHLILRYSCLFVVLLLNESVYCQTTDWYARAGVSISQQFNERTGVGEVYYEVSPVLGHEMLLGVTRSFNRNFSASIFGGYTYYGLQFKQYNIEERTSNTVQFSWRKYNFHSASLKLLGSYHITEQFNLGVGYQSRIPICQRSTNTDLVFDSEVLISKTKTNSVYENPEFHSHGPLMFVSSR